MKRNIIAFVSLFALVAFAAGFIAYRPTTTSASTSVGSSYQYVATAVQATNLFASTTSVIATGTGTFGSFVITGAVAGTETFYDASTTDATKRTISATTSLLVIASFPASTAAGTYTFDTNFYNGLLLVVSGNIATGTISWRPY